MTRVVSWKNFEQFRTRRLRPTRQLALSWTEHTPLRHKEWRTGRSPLSALIPTHVPKGCLRQEGTFNVGIPDISIQARTVPSVCRPKRWGEGMSGVCVSSLDLPFNGTHHPGKATESKSKEKRKKFPERKLTEFQVKDKPPKGNGIIEGFTSSEAHQSAPRVRSCSLQGP